MSTPSTQNLAGMYLTFILGRESYAVPVLKVREIIRLTSITAMPQIPAYIRGVINLRGKIIPVMNLRRRFGFADAANAEQNCIVVVQVLSLAGQPTVMRLIVDAVEEVAKFAAGDIEETPNSGARIATDCLQAMAKLKGVVKALLDIDKVTGSAALASLANSPTVIL